MELILENGLLSGLSQEGRSTTACPTGRYRLVAVRTEETCLKLAPSDYLLSPGNLTTFSLLLLTYAQKAHHQEAIWLTIK